MKSFRSSFPESRGKTKETLEEGAGNLTEKEIEEGIGKFISTGASENTSTPIVAPGVGGHREKKINLLSDENMLPNSVPKARIRIVGYDLRSASKDTPINFEAAATDLNKHINQEASDGSIRPTILIGHAYGGVIIGSFDSRECFQPSQKTHLGRNCRIDILCHAF